MKLVCVNWMTNGVRVVSRPTLSRMNHRSKLMSRNFFEFVGWIHCWQETGRYTSQEVLFAMEDM